MTYRPTGRESMMQAEKLRWVYQSGARREASAGRPHVSAWDESTGVRLQATYTCPAGRLDCSDIGEELETWIDRGQRRRDRKVANQGMALPSRQRRLTTEREQTPQNRLSAREEGGGADDNTEMRGVAAAHAERGEH